MHYLETAIRNMRYRFKGRLFKLYLLLHGCKVGKGLKCLAFPKFRGVPPRGSITIGNHVALGRNVTFEITQTGHITLHNHALVADNVLLSSLSGITIGEWTAIAENVSIRDSFHKMARNQFYRLQDSDTEPVVIGKDAGVGAGCVVLKGSHIPDGVFVGSGTVVTKSDKMEPYGLYAGKPLQLIRMREEV